MQQPAPQGRHRRPRFQQYGKLARKRREQRGWTQEEVANRLGTISRAQLSRIESGHSRPSPLLLNRLGIMLDIPIEDSYALTGYLPCGELPGLRAYLIAKHRDWPAEVIDDIEAFCDVLKTRRGLSD